MTTCPTRPCEARTADPASAAGEAVLTVDLGAIARNYRFLRDAVRPARLGAVVKADAYGLGIERVAPALYRAGAGEFFVATLREGLRLRSLLTEATIYVFHGPARGEEAAFREARLVPVLNSLEQIAAWAAVGASGAPSPAAIHIDTGMNRLGLAEAELERLTHEPARLAGLDIRLVMSHLACADDRTHPMNERQRARFERARTCFPHGAASLANSGGLLLGRDFHYDLVRAGIALYGGNPQPRQPNPLTPVIRLDAPILQAREIDSPETVGYGATHSITRKTRIVTVPIGYGDGYPRSLGNHAKASIEGFSVPVIGRVSMDLLTLDVTDVPADLCRPGLRVDLIGGEARGTSLDEIAACAGTIAYEILTNLGRRYPRSYINDNDDNGAVGDEA